MKNEAIITEAIKTAGIRERYAIKHAESIEKKTTGNHILYVFRYSKSDPYQDANGATYDKTYKKWVN